MDRCTYCGGGPATYRIVHPPTHFRPASVTLFCEPCKRLHASRPKANSGEDDLKQVGIWFLILFAGSLLLAGVAAGARYLLGIPQS